MPMIPFVKTGYLGTNQWVPLVNGNGLTAGGGEPVPEIVWVKVSGTSPLSLPGAIANSIKFLTQYGLCTQASTPTPDAPVDIMCNNGAIRWGAVGKNLINPDAAGAVNGSYINDGGVLLSDNTSFLSDYIPVVEGETYTAQGYKTFDGLANLRVHGFDASKTWTRMLAKEPMQTNKVTSTTFVIPSGVKYVRVCGYIGYRGGIDAMLELGSSASAYEPFVGGILADGTPEVLTVSATGAETQTVTVPMLLSVGDYKDEAEIISGGVTHKVGIRILTGEETGWALSDSGTTHRFRGTKPSDCHTPASRAPSVCTHFKYVSTGSAVGGMFIGASQYWYFIPTDQTIDTAEKWTAWLAAQYAAGTPVIVLYPLAEETTEQTTPHALHTSEGDNVVDVTANVSPISLECEYANGYAQ